MDASQVDHYRDTLLPVLTENLIPDNSFVNYSMNDDEYADSDVVRLTNKGSLPGIKKNRQQVPAQASKREDKVNAYNLSEFTTDPTVVQLNEQVVVSYDKLSSVIEDHREMQEIQCTEATLDVWTPDGGGVGPSSRIYETTGDARPAVIIPGYDEHGTGQVTLTGQRKRITKEDFVAMATKMNLDNIPKAGRYALVSSSQHEDLLLIDDFVRANFTGKDRTALEAGIVGYMCGFTIMERSSVTFYNPDGTVKQNNADIEEREQIPADSCEGAMFWHERFVRQAMGTIDIFLEARKAGYYGDIMSTSVRFGGMVSYLSGKGVYILKDALV